MKKDSVIHCPKKQAKFELFRKTVLKNSSQTMKEVGIIEKEVELENEKTKVLEYAYDNTKKINDSIIEKLSKITFTVANAYPYAFDSTLGMITNRQEISQKYKKDILKFHDIKESIFFMIDVPFKEFLDWALDGDISQRNRLIQDLINLAATPPKDLQKYIPISAKYCAKVAPIQIVLIRKNEEEILASKLNSLKNLSIRKINKGTPDEKTIKLPIERIQIHVLKSLFQDLLIGKHGVRWFEIPKALQAKIVDFHPKYPKIVSKYLERLSKELKELQEAKEKSHEEEEKKKRKEYKAFEKEEEDKRKEYKAFENILKNFPSPMILRRAYFYIKMHLTSNILAEKINVDATDFFTHVDPSYLRGVNIAGGKEMAIAFLNTVYNFFIDLEKEYKYCGKRLKPIEIKSIYGKRLKPIETKLK